MRRSTVFVSLYLALALAAGAASAAPLDPPVRIGILGDRTGSAVPGVHEGIVAELARLRPDLVLSVGDMIEGYSEDSLAIEAMWAEYDSIVAPLDEILHRTPGNHDITTAAMEPAYRRHCGPPDASFDYRGTHVVKLDSSRWDTFAQIPAAQLGWLTEDLKRAAKAPLTLVVMHKPLWYSGVAAGQPDPLHELFVKSGVDAVFTGHFHQYMSGAFDGIVYASVGSSGGGVDPGGVGPMYHFTWVTADARGVHVAPIEAGSVLPWDEVTVAEVRTREALARSGLRFPESFRVSADPAPHPLPLTVLVDNGGGAVALEDTLRWTVPEGWTVEPAVAPIRVAPGSSAMLNFQAGRGARLYPVPSVALDIPYAAGKKVHVEKALRIARTALALRGTPTLDGRLDDPCWREPVDRLYDVSGEGARTDPVRFYFAYDDRNLYLGAVCHDTRIDSLREIATLRDGTVYTDDCVGWFLEPVMRSGTAYQIYINPRGAVFDQKITRDAGGAPRGDPRWNADLEIRTARSPFAWAVEASLPLAQFAARTGENQPWPMNFRRKQPRLGAAADWQVPIDYDPETYGLLMFK
jgi:hypothetical protein